MGRKQQWSALLKLELPNIDSYLTRQDKWNEKKGGDPRGRKQMLQSRGRVERQERWNSPSLMWLSSNKMWKICGGYWLNQNAKRTRFRRKQKIGGSGWTKSDKISAECDID